MDSVRDRELIRIAGRWKSLAPTLRKLVDEPEEIEDVLQLILTAAIREIPEIDEGSVYRVQPLETPKTLVQIEQRIKGVGGKIGRDTAKPRFPAFEEGDGSAASVAMQTCKPVFISDCTSEEGPYKPYGSGQQLKSLACIPVNYGEAVMAVMCVHSVRRRHKWVDDDREYLEALSSIAANAIGANHSELTILPNRRQMDYIVGKAIRDQSGSTGDRLWLAYMDLDHFGEVNRKFDHGPADEVIMQFAAILDREKGSSGQVFHRHGDEFSILWQDLTRDEVLARAKRIAEVVRSFDFTVKGKSVRSKLNRDLSASMGIQQWTPSLNGQELTAKADKISGKAKVKGEHKGLIMWCDGKGHTGQRSLRPRPS